MREGEAADNTTTQGRMHRLAAMERPRERLLRLGPDALSAVELLALLLGQGSTRSDVLATAEVVLSRGGDGPDSLLALSRLSADELMAVAGVGPARAAAVVAAFELGRRAGARAPARLRIGDAGAAVALVSPWLDGLRHEEFWVLCLDARHALLARKRVGMGGPTATPADPRTVFAEAVRTGASGIVVVHNHPSGDPAPSEADRALTRALQMAGEAVGIGLYDHVVLGRGVYYSFRSAGDIAIG